MSAEVFWSTIEYFEQREFGCPCGCGINNPSPQLVMKLDKARARANTVFSLNSACRCPEHNASEAVGGLPDSAHIATAVEQGEAADIKYVSSEQCFKIVEGLLYAGFKRILIYKTFIHADVDATKPSPVLKRM